MYNEETTLCAKIENVVSTKMWRDDWKKKLNSHHRSELFLVRLMPIKFQNNFYILNFPAPFSAEFQKFSVVLYPWLYPIPIIPKYIYSRQLGKKYIKDMT